MYGIYPCRVHEDKSGGAYEGYAHAHHSPWSRCNCSYRSRVIFYYYIKSKVGMRRRIDQDRRWVVFADTRNTIDALIKRKLRLVQQIATYFICIRPSSLPSQKPDFLQEPIAQSLRLRCTCTYVLYGGSNDRSTNDAARASVDSVAN